MSTLRVTGLKQETSSATNISLAVGGGVTVAGISTFYNNTIFTNDVTVSGNISVGGTLTYQDVTDVDSIGIITARNGIHVSGGNVGVNTTTFPVNGTNLKVSDGTISRLALDKTGTNARQFEIGNFGTGLNIYDLTADAERLRITSDGNVGLGTNNPASRFDVSEIHGGDICITNPTNYGTIPGLSPTLRNDNGIIWRGNIHTGFGSVDDIKTTNYIKSVLENTSTGNSSVQGRYSLTFGTAAGGGAAQQAVERMRITSGGDMLIGGTLPSSPNAEIKANGQFRCLDKPVPQSTTYLKYATYGYDGQTLDVAAEIAAAVAGGATWAQAIVTLRGFDGSSVGYWHGIYSNGSGVVRATELANSGEVTLTVNGGNLTWPGGTGTGQWYNTTITITLGAS